MKVLRFCAFASAVLFFAAAVWLGRPIGGLWNSPDETSNAFWAERVAIGAPLLLHDDLVGLAHGALHPRSMAVVGDALAPGSFPGLILLYGALRAMFKFPLYAFTPIITTLAGLLFGALVARLFDKRTGYWATLLFFLHPAILYYGARGLFHNVLCVDLVVIAAALFVLRPFRSVAGRHEILDDALGGFALGWAVATRASEALWILPAFLAFLPFAGPRRWRRLAVAFLGAVLPILVFLQTNASVYGSPFRIAYVSPAPIQASVGATTPASPPVSEPSMGVSFFLLPFGLHPRLIARHVWEYGLKLFWWQSLLALAGVLWWLKNLRHATSAQKTYVAAALAVSVWLSALYGSWDVHDRLDAATVSIGISYVRYFLPAYVAALPLAALALSRLHGVKKYSYLAVILAALSAILGARIAVFAGDESLMAVRATIASNVQKKQALIEVVPSDAVVMTERFDKIFMPDRLRFIPSTDDGAFAAAEAVIPYAPVYWYGLDPSEADLARLVDQAGRHGMMMFKDESPIPGESLYQFERLTIDNE